MANTQSDVVSAAALGKLKEADFLCLIESELREAYKAERTRLEALHDDKATKILELSKERETIEANIIRDCQIALAMDDGFAQLAYRFQLVNNPSLFQPTQSSKCKLVVESTKLEVLSNVIAVTLTLVVSDTPPPADSPVKFAYPIARAPITFTMPIPENLQNVLNKMSELRKQQAALRKEIEKPNSRNVSVSELARNVLAKARLKALTGSETIFKPEALVQQLRQMA